MMPQVSFEQVEDLAIKLPPAEQLKLLTRLSEQLHGTMLTLSLASSQKQPGRDAKADALLAELDTIAESIEGQFDSVEDLRLIREERVARL